MPNNVPGLEAAQRHYDNMLPDSYDDDTEVCEVREYVECAVTIHARVKVEKQSSDCTNRWAAEDVVRAFLQSLSGGDYIPDVHTFECAGMQGPDCDENEQQIERFTIGETTVFP